MASEVTLTNGERLTIGATIEELRAAIEKKANVIEFDRVDTGQPVNIAVAHITHFAKAAEPTRRVDPGSGPADQSYFAFRGTLAPVNRANGDPAVAVLSARANSQQSALAHVEKDQSSRGYRFAKVTASAGPCKTAAEAEAKLAGEGAKA